MRPIYFLFICFNLFGPHALFGQAGNWEICLIWNIRNDIPAYTYEKGISRGWLIKVCLDVSEQDEATSHLRSAITVIQHKYWRGGKIKLMEKKWFRGRVILKSPQRFGEFKDWLFSLYELSGRGKEAGCVPVDTFTAECWYNNFSDDTVVTGRYIHSLGTTSPPHQLYKCDVCPDVKDSDCAQFSSNRITDRDLRYGFDISLREEEEDKLELHLYAAPDLEGSLLGQSIGSYVPFWQTIRLIDEVVFQDIFRQAAKRVLPFHKRFPSLSFFIQSYEEHCENLMQKRDN